MLFAILFTGLSDLGSFAQNPVVWILTLFHFWMLIDAIRREEWMWALFIFLFPLINSVLYFFIVWWPIRGSGGGPGFSFEWPGFRERRRISPRSLGA